MGPPQGGSSALATHTAVTGATGFVGRHVTRELVERSTRVRALARDREKVGGALPDEGVTPVFGDLSDRKALAELMRGCKSVVHCVGIRRETGPGVTFERVHVEGVQRVVDAAREAGVRRIVHISALGVRPDAPTDYQRTKWHGEQIVRTSGLDWTILRPSLIHGPDGELIQMMKGWVLGREAPHFFMPYFARVDGKPPAPPKLAAPKVQPVSVVDVAWAVGECLEQGESIGEVYELGGGEVLTWPEMLTTFRDALPYVESKKRIVPLPAPLGVAMARGAKTLGLGQMLPFGPDEPRMAQEDSVCSIAKAERHLGFEPVGFTPALREYADRV